MALTRPAPEPIYKNPGADTQPAAYPARAFFIVAKRHLNYSLFIIHYSLFIIFR